MRLGHDIARAHGLTAEAEYTRGYPVTVNDAAESAFATATAADIFGASRALTPAQPLTGAEDFSFVLSQVPGAFILLGACPPGTAPETAPSNHSAAAVFDDAVLTGRHRTLCRTGTTATRSITARCRSTRSPSR